MVALTENATAALKRLIASAEDEVHGLRIMVEQGGCSGMQYMLGLEGAAQDGDEVYDFDGVKVYVDAMSLPVVDSLQIDFVDSLEKSGFVFENPKAQNVCSCGKSFEA